MRTETTSPAWPRRFPLYRLLGLMIALACGFTFFRLWLRTAPALEGFYLVSYIRTTVIPELPTFSFRKQQGTVFRVVFNDAIPMTAAPPSGRESSRVSIRILKLKPDEFGHWLKANIYRNRSVISVLAWPLGGFASCLLIFVVSGSILDRKQERRARDGQLLRGPSLISRWQFNRQTKGQGLRFRLSNRRNLFELLQPNDFGKDLVIRLDREAHHIQIAGDTGTGKSTLIRQIIYQIEARGEIAIIFDPDREYIQEFFNEERGDWVLNPKDERCPYWPIGEEADDEAQATPISIGLFPDEMTSQKFFLNHTRAIFAYLLATYKPTVNELAYWMAHPEHIDARVTGTEHEHTLTVNAAPQRAGILGSLNEAGKPLRMMPSHVEGRRIWTVRDWAKDRKGWIFITSTPDTIDALRPLQSLWLDMLILKLQTNAPGPGQKKVWMILDELASLNVLPQLQTALTKQRKSDNPIVLGFQGMSQLDNLYGKKAETIASQAFTNIVLRTREPRAAKHQSDLLGKAQLERVRESKPSHLLTQRQQGSFSSERVIDPVVLESEIQGLDDLRGYFVQQDKIVAIRFQPFAKRKLAPGLIERIIPPVQHRPLDPEALVKEVATTRVARGRGRAKKPAAENVVGMDMLA